MIENSHNERKLRGPTMFLNCRLLAVTCFVLITTTNAIVGGRNASQNEFPGLVWFQIGSRFCLGSLIDLNIVLTSASCVEGHDDSINVTAGDYLLFEDNGTEQMRLSSQIIMHESFNTKGNLNDDIALIHLSSAFQLTRAVQTVKIAEADFEPEDAGYGFAVGWGETTTMLEEKNDSILIDARLSPVLLRAEVILTKASTCNDLHGSEIPSEQFCTHGKGGTQSDRGGPLFCKEIKNVTCGILSSTWEDQSGFNNAVAGYIKLKNYLEWIEDHRNRPVVPTTSSTLMTSKNPPTTTPETQSSTIHSIICEPNEPPSIIYLTLLLILSTILFLSCGTLAYKLIAIRVNSNQERNGGFSLDEIG